MYLALYKSICYLISFNKMLENKKITRIKRGSEKNFGIVLHHKNRSINISSNWNFKSIHRLVLFLQPLKNTICTTWKCTNYKKINGCRKKTHSMEWLEIFNLKIYFYYNLYDVKKIQSFKYQILNKKCVPCIFACNSQSQVLLI